MKDKFLILVTSQQRGAGGEQGCGKTSGKNRGNKNRSLGILMLDIARGFLSVTNVSDIKNICS